MGGQESLTKGRTGFNDQWEDRSLLPMRGQESMTNGRTGVMADGRTGVMADGHADDLCPHLPTVFL